MATTTPFAYNPSLSPISGTTQVGQLAVGTTEQDYSISPGGVTWWMGPDEDLGYVIAQPVSADTQPTNIFSGNLTLSSTYKGTDISLSNNNQTATQLFGYQQSVLGQTLIDNVDKVMFSVQSNVCAGPGNPFFQSIGVGTTSMNYSTQYGAYPGNDTQSVGFSMDGNFYFNGSLVQSGLPTWTTNNIIDIAVDLYNDLIWIRVNGGGWAGNPAGANDPATNQGGLSLNGLTSFYPVLSPGNDVGQMTIQNSAIYGLPEGYQLLGSNLTGSVGFFRTSGFNDNEFVDITNILLNSNYNNPVEASSALTSNGYWNSYISPVLYLDAGNSLSYSGSGTVWTDLIGGKQFNLVNGPNYDPANGGKIYFSASSSQYAQCNTSLQSLPEFTTSVWHNWDGTNTGEFPCILTEVYVAGTINYVLGKLQGGVAQSGYFNGGFQISPQFTLSANTWYNIVTTCDSSQVVKVYLNNVLISTTPTTGSQPSSSNAGIRLMRRWDFAENWGGYLSTVAIYDKALNSGQISSIWDATKSRYGLGPVPTPTPTPTNTITPTPTPTNTVTPTPTATNTPTPSPTNTPTPTPTTSPIPVTGFGYNLVVLPYNTPTSGNTIFPTFATPGLMSGTTNPNTFDVNGIYWNIIDNSSVDRTSYYSGMTGVSVTAYFTQNSNTVIYSGSPTAFIFDIAAGGGFNYNPGARPGQLTLIQSAPTNFVTGQTVYISYIVN